MAYVDHLRLSGLKSELVKDRYVVLCTVTMTTQKHKTKAKHQSNKKHPQTKHKKQQPNKTRNQPHKPKRDVTDSSSWVNGLINARGDNFVSSQLVWQSNKQTKNNQTTRPYQRVSEATKYHAETRDPPRQDPRDHMAQAVKA